MASPKLLETFRVYFKNDVDEPPPRICQRAFVCVLRSTQSGRYTDGSTSHVPRRALDLITAFGNRR
jgi:hypothetical protein